MDISFYVLLTLACLVLLLAMWVCASANTPKWGPDTTLELPPHLLQQVFFGAPSKQTEIKILTQPMATAPSDMPSDPLLSNEYPTPVSNPYPSKYQPTHTSFDASAVRVLPTHFVPSNKLRPVYCFTTEEPA